MVNSVAMQQQQWKLLFSLWSVPVITSGNNRPTQESKCFLCGPITGFITRLISLRIVINYEELLVIALG
jgi:hypothetical protein